MKNIENLCTIIKEGLDEKTNNKPCILQAAALRTSLSTSFKRLLKEGNNSLTAISFPTAVCIWKNCYHLNKKKLNRDLKKSLQEIQIK